MTLQEYMNNWDQSIVSWLGLSSCGSPMFTWANVQKDFMPEPFMGDPNNCSFVIVNMNPGAGQCHSCIPKKNVLGTLINKVATLGYSKVVKDFPYLQEEKNVGLKDWDNSGGRKWWIAKERWIKHMLSVCDSTYNPLDPIPHGYFPFAMELFAWHTEKWPGSLNNKMKNGGVYGQIIKSEVLDPLYEAIKISKYKFAFCVGKPIADIIDSFVFLSK